MRKCIWIIGLLCWLGIAHDTAAQRRGYLGDQRPMGLVETLDSIGTAAGDSLDTARSEMPDSASRVVVDSLARVWTDLSATRGEMPDSASRVVIDSLVRVWADLSAARAEMPDSAGRVVSDSLLDVRGLSLNLKKNFESRTIQITGTDDYANWGNASGGTHADDATNYKTDKQAIELTGSSGGHGGYCDFANRDLTHFADQDTSLDTDYLTCSFFLDSSATYIWYDSLAASGPVFRWSFTSDASPTETNRYFYDIDKSLVTRYGWTYIKVTKSSFSVDNSPNWNDIEGLSFVLYGPQGTAKVTVDNFQMVRKAESGAWPSPLDDDWLLDGNKNIWIVKESDKVRLMCADNHLSKIISAASFGDWDAHGITDVVGSAGTVGLFYSHGKGLYISSNVLTLETTGDNETAAFAVSPGDRVHWRLTHQGTSAVGGASLDGINWTAVSGTWASGNNTIALYTYDHNRRAAAGLSSISFAARAGVAYRVEGLYWRGDTLFFWPAGLNGDSTAFLVPTGMTKF